jgi:UDP-glucose 4-epimerase
MLSPVRVQFTYESGAAADGATLATGTPCTPRSIARAGRAGCPTASGRCFMKALVTGCAGFIGSTLAERLLADGADVVGIDCFTDYYPRAIKERNLAGALGHPRFRFVESPLQDADLPALLKDRTHVFHLAAQAGVRKSWGRDFAIYTVNNIEATQTLLEAACGMTTLERFVYSSSSSVYGDHTPMPMREDALPQPVSPYGVSKLAAEQLCYLYFSNYGVPTVSLRYFTVYGPRQRPDMGFHKFLRATILGEPITLYGDGDQTRDFTFVSDAVAPTWPPPREGFRARVQYWRRVARVGQRGARDDRAHRRPQAADQRRSGQKGDMRHTYADTSLARADLGTRPPSGSKRGSRPSTDG